MPRPPLRGGSALWLVVFAVALPTTPLSAQSPGGAADEGGAKVGVSVRRYPVRGTSFLEAYREIERAGPVDGDGVRRHGLTTYEIQPSWILFPRTNGCAVGSVQVAANVIIRLPEWTGFDGADDLSKRGWQTYIDELRAHEYRHRDIAVEAADRLAEQLALIRGSTCEEARGRAYQTMQRIDRAMRQKQRALDGG